MLMRIYLDLITFYIVVLIYLFCYFKIVEQLEFILHVKSSTNLNAKKAKKKY